MNEDLEITDEITIPSWELSYTTSTSGGPGGQHANRSQTRVTVVWYPGSTSILSETPERRAYLQRRLARHVASDGAIKIVSSVHRSQRQNLIEARDRLGEVIREALHRPTRRKKTRPTVASRRRRLNNKRARGELKRLRRDPTEE